MGQFNLKESIVEDAEFHNQIYETKIDCNWGKSYFLGFKSHDRGVKLKGLFVFINDDIFEGSVKLKDHSEHGRHIYSNGTYYIWGIQINKKNGEGFHWISDNEIYKGRLDFNEYKG